MTKPHPHHHAAESTLSKYLDLRGILTGVVVVAVCAVAAWLFHRVRTGRAQLGCFGKIDKSNYVRVDVVAPSSVTATISKVEVVARRSIVYRLVQALFRVEISGDNARIAMVHNQSFSVGPGRPPQAFGVTLPDEATLPTWWNPFAKPAPRRWKRRELRLKIYSDQTRRLARGEEQYCRYSRLHPVSGTLKHVP